GSGIVGHRAVHTRARHLCPTDRRADGEAHDNETSDRPARHWPFLLSEPHLRNLIGWSETVTPAQKVTRNPNPPSAVVVDRQCTLPHVNDAVTSSRTASLAERTFVGSVDLSAAKCSSQANFTRSN